MFNNYPPINSGPLRLFHDTTDRYKFHDLVDQNLQLNFRLKTNDDVDITINNLINIIQTAAWLPTQLTIHILLKITRFRLISVILIVEKRRALALYQCTRLPSHKKLYNKLGNSLKKVLSKIKNLSLVNFLTNLSANNGCLWKASKQALHHKVSNPPIKKSDGRFASTDSEKAELFKNHLFNVFQPH